MRSSKKVIFGVLLSVATVTVRTATSLALSINEGVQAAHGADQPSDLFGDTGMFTTVVNVLLFLVGALAVIMIVIGGLRYVLSGGNAASVTSAKNTILYAIVGIVVALLAYAAIQFVVNAFAAGGTAGL